jgi:phosphatidylglycerophosphatase A
MTRQHHVYMTPRQRLLLRFGSLGPIGHLPASGTMAVALVGVPLYYLLSARLHVPTWAYALGTLALTMVAIWVHEVGDRILGVKDSRTLVIDELAGFAIAMMGVPFTWKLALIGFVLERGLDILKLWPANRIERRWPGGWGVVGDDVVAGIYTCVALHVLMRVTGW